MHLNGMRWIIFIFTLKYMAHAERILSILGFEGPRQYAFILPLLRNLVQRGHHVTSITNFPQEQSMENFREIVISENEYLYNDLFNTIIDPYDKDNFNVRGKLCGTGFRICENILRHKDVQNLLHHDSFDLIILDLIFTESLVGFAQHFQATIVGFSTIGATRQIDELVDNITPLSYVSNINLKQPYMENMSFFQRCINVIFYGLEWLYYYYEYFPIQKDIYRRYFPNSTKALEDIMKNFSLVLLNDHFTLSAPRPYVPNMIEVAGLHIPENPQPLTTEIQEILNAAEQGFVYVAIENLLPDKLMQLLLHEFQDVQQLILWNTKSRPSPNLVIPSNVHFVLNLSHHSILSHPSIKLLICHGGYNHIIDSIYHGVPVLSIANVHGQQEDYIDFISKMNHGFFLQQTQFNRKSLRFSLQEFLTKDRYGKEAKLKSLQFRDQLNSPLERSTYWIEYVLRHKGAPHIRNLGQNLSSWQFYNHDVYIFLCIVGFILSFLAYLTLNIFIKLSKMVLFKNKCKKD
ncbi:UDP-glucosyltransferase 2-like [Haematobia irritans]|uniref:UDP-glucosyltransferase 2-like n=1 Tax=Haematobia irritans TaxID=7368 RepID=UPI003F4FB6E0